MWQCANCGTMIATGAVCPACGEPITEALNAIRQKARHVRFRRGVADRWMWWGAKIGFVLGAVLGLGFLVVALVIGLVKQRNFMEIVESVGILLPFVLIGAILLALLCAAVFLVIGVVIKPIFIALFGSIERFEQEYGSGKS